MRKTPLRQDGSLLTTGDATLEGKRTVGFSTRLPSKFCFLKVLTPFRDFDGLWHSTHIPDGETDPHCPPEKHTRWNMGTAVHLSAGSLSHGGKPKVPAFIVARSPMAYRYIKFCSVGRGGVFADMLWPFGQTSVSVGGESPSAENISSSHQSTNLTQRFPGNSRRFCFFNSICRIGLDLAALLLHLNACWNRRFRTLLVASFFLVFGQIGKANANDVNFEVQGVFSAKMYTEDQRPIASSLVQMPFALAYSNAVWRLHVQASNDYYEVFSDGTDTYCFFFSQFATDWNRKTLITNQGPAASGYGKPGAKADFKLRLAG